MNNLRHAQAIYDAQTPDDQDAYRDSPLFADFCDHVTIELLNGRDCQGIDSQIFMIDLELADGGYQMALEWVCEVLTEDQFKEWLN